MAEPPSRGQRLRASAGTVVFLILVPGTVAGLVPWLITRWQPAQPAWPVGVRALGAILIAAGAALLAEAFWRFARDGLGTPAPVAPTERLVVTGSYRFVRNPMYVAVLAVILGQCMALGRAELAAYAALIWAMVASFVRLYEEPTLRERYGDQYADYCRHVRAWVPRARPYTSKL